MLLIIQKSCFNIVMTLLKASAETRNKTLEWFREVLNRNKDRIKQQTDQLAICSPGFLTNFTQVLMMLVEPIMDTTNKKVLLSCCYTDITQIELIDPNYLILNTKLTLDEYTCLGMDSKEFSEYKESVNRKQEAANYAPNFITESFYFTMLALELGVINLFMVCMEISIAHSKLGRRSLHSS